MFRLLLRKQLNKSIRVKTITEFTRFVALFAGVTLAGYPLHADNGSFASTVSARLVVVGLTDAGELVQFRAGYPEGARSVGYVTGLNSPDTALIGIDYRVQDGKLYGVGNSGGVYTIDDTTGVATFVNALTVTLTGAKFDIDFNPNADRLRLVSDTGQNLAHNVNSGGTTTMNDMLTYTAPPGTPTAALGITAVAYTNNDLDSNTLTTLFDIDTMMDQVVIQSPPNNGILVGAGKLGVDAGSDAGFDIYSSMTDTRTELNSGFASLSVGGYYNFYFIRLLPGEAEYIGAFNKPVVDIAIPLNQ